LRDRQRERSQPCCIWLRWNRTSRRTSVYLSTRCAKNILLRVRVFRI
jgi:hypothetical protein